MSNSLVIFPMLLFLLSLLALVSGLGVIYLLRNKQGGWFTTFIWFFFSASISMGFITFGLFVSFTQNNDVLGLAVSSIGIVAVVGAGRLAA